LTNTGPLTAGAEGPRGEGGNVNAASPKTNEELVAAYRAGNRHALESLVTRNEGLVFNLIRRRFPGVGEEIEDEFAQEGRLAIMRAADKFDPGLGFKFSTYATWAIWCAILRVRDKLRRQRRERMFSECEGVIDSVASTRDDLADSDEAEAFRRVWRRAKGVLSTRELQFIRERYIEGCKYREIASRHEMTRANASRIVRQAIEKLRKPQARKTVRQAPDGDQRSPKTIKSERHRSRLRARGLCIVCGRPAEGMVRCAQCRAKRHEYYINRLKRKAKRVVA